MSLSETVEWTKENTDSILKLLGGPEPMVSNARLREEIEATPYYLNNSLQPKNEIRASNKRTAYRGFARSWQRLPMELESRILGGFDKRVYGFMGIKNLLEWLCEIDVDDFARNDREKRAIRPVINSLANFDTGMINRLSLDASRIRMGEALRNNTIGDPVKDAVLALVVASINLGRKSIPKNELEVCTNIFNLWDKLPQNQKGQIFKQLGDANQTEITFPEVISALRATAENAEGTTQELSGLHKHFSKLSPETLNQIVTKSEISYGCSSVRGRKGISPFLTAMQYISNAAGQLGSPRAFKHRGYKTGDFPRALVHHAAWLMVIAGHSELTATDTGLLSNILTEIDYIFFDFRDSRDSWRDMIEDVLGNQDERRAQVKSLQDVTENLTNAIKYHTPPRVVRIG
jgi:hypothetical protein